MNFFSLFRKIVLRRRIKNDNPSDSCELSEEKLKDLEKILGVRIKNKLYYVQALTHRSFLETNGSNCMSNERMEFLGDSVLSLIVAQYLFENFPEEDEGFLTKIRAKLVNRFSLVKFASRLSISDYIIIGNHLQRNLMNNSKSVLADAMEAIIGALFLDHGIEACRSFVFKNLIKPNLEDDYYLIDENFKSQLLEYTQGNKIPTPSYEVIKEDGPQHERVFTVRVSVGDKEMGIGLGRTKKTAEQRAARIALRSIQSKR